MSEQTNAVPSTEVDSISAENAPVTIIENVLSRKEILQLEADSLMQSIVEVFKDEANNFIIEDGMKDNEIYKLILKATKLVHPDKENDLHHFITRRVKKALK